MHQPLTSKRKSLAFSQSRLTKQYSAPSMGSRPKSAAAIAASRWMPARMSCPISAMGVFLAALMVSGGNEELGWRAVLEPELERRIPFFAACLATGAIWGLWHLPLWFTQGAGRETTPLLAFGALAVLLSFWLSALYRAGGCAFSCCLLHALANTLIGVLSLSNISLVIAAARGARPHVALVGLFPSQAPNRRGLRRKTGMACSVN